MSRRVALNIGIVALIALAVVALPGGGRVADLVLGVISLAFLAVMSFFAARLYRENQFTLDSLTTRHRGVLYGAIAVAFATLVATPRLWESGAGTAAWLALLAASGFGVYWVWNESRRYRI
jgi:drug/metabolite transporter (DMT)-like permease